MAKVLSIRRNNSVTSNSSNVTITRSSTPNGSNPDAPAPRRSSAGSLRTLQPEAQDKYIKIILKQFKRIEISFNKFNSKHHGTTKTNILRTTLLPFLRSDSALNPKLLGVKVYKSLVSVGTSIMKRWWACLLNLLVTNSQSSSSSSQPLSSLDRSAYLECISRIISRPEWFYVDDELFECYKELLVLTLDYSIQRLQTIKIIPLSISAFVGKVFAYAFFTIPQVAKALLFLLNVKQSVFEKSLGAFNVQAIPAEIALLKKKFPPHLHYLIQYKGISPISRKQKSYINCVAPPQHPVAGIKDPSGSWVRRWFNSDGDVFNSFFRHYCNVIRMFLGDDIIYTKGILINCPGFNVVFSHIHQIFALSVTRISQNDTLRNVSGDMNSRIPEVNSDRNAMSVSGPTLQNDMYYNSIMKIMRTYRDLYFSSLPFKKSLVQFLDMILISLAKEITIYDLGRNSLIFNIVYEFSNHVDGLNINWEFWLSCTYMMMQNTDHIQILLKSMAFLFNIWEKIPDILSVQTHNHCAMEWIKDRTISYKENFIDWLISSDNWERLFIHWHPIVRSYYLRFLLWRVIGVNNFDSSIRIKITKKVENKLKQSHIRFAQVYKERFPLSNTKVSFKPDNPLVNRKFCIQTITNSSDYLLFQDNAGEVSMLTKPSELRKTHPFEIFDEAVYSCSSLPKSATDNESAEESKRSNSLVTSISKLFKLLAVDDKVDEKPPRPFTQSSKSLSFTSLTTSMSAKSRSSSPSLMSFTSTPTSLTDFSGDSPFNSETSSLESHTGGPKTEPPELFKVPPEIVRPLYKFDVVVDNSSLRDKFYMMNNKHSFIVDEQFYSIPPECKVPTISIFISSDNFNKFYISSDNLILAEDDFGLDSGPERPVFNGKSLRKQANLVNLGKSLFEWNALVDEFESYLIKKVEVDQFSDSGNTDQPGVNKMSETEYFRRIIPFLSVDSSNEAKMLLVA